MTDNPFFEVDDNDFLYAPRARGPVLPAEFAYRLHIPRENGPRIVGKTVRFPDGKVVFWRDESLDKAILRKLNAFSLQASAIPFLKRHRVKEIHFVDSTEGHYWVVPLKDFLRDPVTDEGEGPEVRHSIWFVSEYDLDYGTTFTEKYVELYG